jgi:hypothetical protein
MVVEAKASHSLNGIRAGKRAALASPLRHRSVVLRLRGGFCDRRGEIAVTTGYPLKDESDRLGQCSGMTPERTALGAAGFSVSTSPQQKPRRGSDHQDDQSQGNQENQRVPTVRHAFYLLRSDRRIRPGMVCGRLRLGLLQVNGGCLGPAFRNDPRGYVARMSGRLRQMPRYCISAVPAGWAYHVLWTMRQTPSIRSMHRSSLYQSPANWSLSLTSAVSPSKDRRSIRHA